jgi:hypothetical protein
MNWLASERRSQSVPDDVPVPTFGPRMVCTRDGFEGKTERGERRPFSLPKASPAPAQRAYRL